jgi:signal transduction histidine kinase
LRRQREALWAQFGITLAILGASFVMSAVIGWRLQQAFAEPVLHLAQVARAVTETRNYALRALHESPDEIGRLMRDFNAMLERVAAHERDLEAARRALELEVGETTRANRELGDALTRLRETQAQLVQSEKLASLGALVAGIAHEINTPVGVGVTAASTLLAWATRLRAQHERGELAAADLERFVAVADESTQILLRNLQRAAELIQSFKQVAVDQSSGERRTFALRAYIDEVLVSLAPRLKKTPHEISVSCPASLTVDTYPGAIAQILTNLVSNSLLHAFPGARRGHIRIDVRADHAGVMLEYADDGIGMPAEHRARIFDPFFTTKRGAGGSGLGMHIVYNLVTQLLGGTIEVRSDEGRGTEVRIAFPGGIRQAAA